MHTNLSALFPNDRDRLRAFREAARDAHRLLRQEYDRDFGIGAGKSFIPESVLRAASQPIRLVMLEKEPAYLPDVVAALEKLQDPTVDRDSRTVTNAFERVRNGQSKMQFIERATNRAHTYGAKELLDVWFYGKSFHKEPERKEDLERIKQFGEFAVFELQWTILKLGMVIFALDSLIADILGEETLAEIRAANAPGDEFF